MNLQPLVARPLWDGALLAPGQLQAGGPECDVIREERPEGWREYCANLDPHDCRVWDTTVILDMTRGNS